MLDTLRSLFAELTGTGKPQDMFDDNDYRVAAAALLVHVIGIDGAIAESERTKLHAVLKRGFALTDDETSQLIDEATVVQGEAVDLYRFTSLLNRALDDQGRLRVVEMMWEIIFADGQVTEFEDNIVWRVADLLHVPSRDRIALRRQVAEEQAGDFVPKD